MDSGTTLKRILVIEDDGDIREILTQVLYDAGYEVIGAANGAEGLERLRESPDFGLIILDLMMPVMDGWQFCTQRQLETALVNIPVVILSASTHFEQYGASMGAVGYLRKPIQIDALLHTVARFYRLPDRTS